MPITDIYKKLSVRIIDRTAKPRKNVGSGFLFITKSHAFVFTAAHVINNPDHEYEIECFFRSDEVKADEREQYRYQVTGSEFKMLSDYQLVEDTKAFNKKDVAGIELDLRPWMEGLAAIYFTIPAAGQQICFSGYPVQKWDESIEFAEKSCHTEIQAASKAEKRLQFRYPENADWSSMGDVVEGFSGSGVYEDSEEGGIPLLVGILTCGQGANMPHGSINAVSFQAVKELCDEHSWPSPLYAAEGNPVDIPNLDHIVPNNESKLTRQLSEEVQRKIDEMRDLIRDMKIEDALSLYDGFIQSTAYEIASANDKCYLLFMKARCYLLLGDTETSEALLTEGMAYTVPEKYWHLVEKANLLMNRAGLHNGAVCLEQADKLLEEALRLNVKDGKAKVFKRYIEVIQRTEPLGNKLAYIHELSTDEHMDLNGLQLLYNVEGSLCAQAGEYGKAAEYFNTAYTFQGDACFLIQTARMYLAMAEGKTAERNLGLLEKANNNFVKYLANCGESLANAFYREYGWVFLSSAMELHQYGLIVHHAEYVIAQTTHPDAVKQLYLMKAFAQIEIGGFERETIRHLEAPDQNALYLHMEFKGTMDRYAELLEMASVCKADAQAGIEFAQKIAEKYNGKIEKTLRMIQATASKIGSFLEMHSGGIDKTVCCSLYDDWISGLLNCKNAAEYKKAIAQYQALFPELADAHERNQILLPEVCGEPYKTEFRLLKYLSRGRNPQRMQFALNFYFRNLDYNGVIELYENLLEDSNGVGQFARKGLLWGYLDYLSKPKCMVQKASKQYLLYKDELSDQNLCDIIEKRINHG